MRDVLFSYKDEYDVCYSSPDRAVSELMQRRKNIPLTARVRKKVFFTKAMEDAFEQPRIVLFRQVASPLLETLEFLKIAKSLGLKPLIFEYHKDKFVSAGNLFKRGLGKLPIFKFTSKNDIDIFEYKTIVDFNKYTGVDLAEVKTLKNEYLVDVHHKLFKEICDVCIIDVTLDLSEWFHLHKGNASEYYAPLMTIFLRDAILCENFVTTSTEEDFFTKVARPAFKEVCEEFGLDPLVLRIIDKKHEQREKWNCYPDNVTELLSKNGYS